MYVSVSMYACTRCVCRAHAGKRGHQTPGAGVTGGHEQPVGAQH